MSTRVLVVGGAGYIGGAVTDFLQAKNCEIRVYDGLLYDDAYRKKVDFVYGDIRQRDRLAAHLDWADAVIWLAALVADGSCALYPELAVELNTKSVEWLVQNFDGRIIFPSTCLVYAIQDAMLDESAPTDPLTIYSRTKLAAEKLLKDKALIVRLSTVFGISDSFSRPRLDLVVNLLTARAMREGKMTVFGGAQYRPFIHVRDVGKVMADNIGTAHSGIFNLHTENMRIADLAGQISSHIPHAQLEVQSATIEQTGDYKMISDKAREMLGFNPQYTIDEGISEMKELALRLKDIRNPRYSNEAFLRANPII